MASCNCYAINILPIFAFGCPYTNVTAQQNGVLVQTNYVARAVNIDCSSYVPGNGSKNSLCQIGLFWRSIKLNVWENQTVLNCRKYIFWKESHK